MLRRTAGASPSGAGQAALLRRAESHAAIDVPINRIGTLLARARGRLARALGLEQE